MKKLTIALPLVFMLPTGYFAYKQRKEYLNDPVMRRALQNLKNDQRVLDFCGDQVKPGWIIRKKQLGGENWVKYDLNIKGLSGKLRTAVIGDYLTHQELKILEDERLSYQEQKSQPQQENKEETRDEYVPVDFDAYSILAKETEKIKDQIDSKKPIEENEKIWRISSLTAQIDEETKILLLPLSESKRKVKIQDTKYNLNTYEDLLNRAQEIEQVLTKEKEIVRFEDKTPEEIQEDMKRRRHQQYQKMVKIRSYQFGGMFIAIFGYLFVYRKFIASKSVMNSAIYHQTLTYLKSNDKITKYLGKHIQVMNCNGKISPIKDDVNFDLILFGSNQKGKVQVKTRYNKSNQQWLIQKIDLFTRDNSVKIL